ncbi:MAG: energy transducer TonB [Pseudomonadota bacterium]|nr:energy transducer TonB [Pseudomonadota bacterium]
MSLSPYRPVPRWQRVLRSSAVGVSVGVHVVFAIFLLSNPAAAQKASQWVEVTLNEPKPPPPKPPEPKLPEPEPEKPKPVPKVVKFEDTTPTPPPPNSVAPPPEPARRVVRQVQGLTANSFAPGASTGLSVRAGNSTGVAAGKDSMSLGEASGPFEARPYTAVTKAPRLQWSPMMDVPDEARKANVKGIVKVLLDLDAKGKVTRVQIVHGLGFGVDEACVAAYRKSQWKPAEQDGVAVAVIGVPESCAVNEI